MKKIFFLLVVLWVSPLSYAESIIVCLKGKVSIGDTLNEVKKRCVFDSTSQGGMRPIGKNKIPTSFQIRIKKLPDGSKIRFLFLDDKLAFVFH